jgi:hypothetical protein
MLAECAAVCLASTGHGDGAVLSLTGLHERRCRIDRIPVTDQMARAYADLQEATEYGASGLAALVVECTEKHTIYERSPKDGGGFDYYLVPMDAATTDDDNFLAEATARLEVSGILHGDPAAVDDRVVEKVVRIKARQHALPAYVVVIAFACLCGKMVAA